MFRWLIVLIVLAACQSGLGQIALGTEAKQSTQKGSQSKSSQVACEPFASAAEVAPPTPQAGQHFLDRFQIINKSVLIEPYAILFLGDSLTEDWDATIWQQHFAERAALNAGIKGDRTEHLIWRLQHGNLEGPSPTGVVLLIGTNDVGLNRSSAVIAEGIRANLELLRLRFPNASILLLGLLPRNHSPKSPRRIQIRQVNDLVQKCADGRHVFYADIGDFLLDPAGWLSAEISPDGVHLSQEGYAILSERLENEIARILPGGGH